MKNCPVVKEEMLFKDIVDEWRTMDEGQRPILLPDLVHSTGELIRKTKDTPGAGPILTPGLKFEQLL